MLGFFKVFRDLGCRVSTKTPQVTCNRAIGVLNSGIQAFWRVLLGVLGSTVSFEVSGQRSRI